MRSLSLVRMPCFRRCSMISTTSPNHEGVEGTECEEVWMMTEESAILVMCTSLLGKMCILPQERHILCLLATNYISLRNSWDQRPLPDHGYSFRCGILSVRGYTLPIVLPQTGS